MRRRGGDEHADRFIFLRERFSLAAFLFGPLWMIWRRLWLVLIIYLIATSLIALGLRSLGIPVDTRITVYMLVQLLVAIEAANLRRWTLLRRGWRDRGIVFGDDLELAEQRFFAANAARHDAASSTSPPIEPEPMQPPGRGTSGPVAQGEGVPRGAP
jgi:hypothetical protein